MQQKPIYSYPEKDEPPEESNLVQDDCLSTLYPGDAIIEYNMQKLPISYQTPPMVVIYPDGSRVTYDEYNKRYIEEPPPTEVQATKDKGQDIPSISKKSFNKTLYIGGIALLTASIGTTLMICQEILCSPFMFMQKILQSFIMLLIWTALVIPLLEKDRENSSKAIQSPTLDSSIETVSAETTNSFSINTRHSF